MSNQKSFSLERLLEIFFSLGAVPVILGALFKLTYSAPFGSPNTWLQVGLYTEALVFLTYALVYIFAPHKLSASSVNAGHQAVAPVVNVQNVGTVAAMENMLKAADITPESLQKLSDGFKTLEANIGKISAASSSVADTELYA
ncbi:MAG: gliding motility protein GldL, partial [Chitinophagaceae bacterium]